MADLITKLQELEEIISEFDIFKNYHRDTGEIDSNNFHSLLFKIDLVKEYIIRSQEKDSATTKKNESQNKDILVKSQWLMDLNELKEKIVNEFQAFKHNAADQIDPKNVDTILFKIKFQIDNMKNYILLGTSEDGSNEFKDLAARKANALIKLQTLANSITCHIMNLDNNM